MGGANMIGLHEAAFSVAPSAGAFAATAGWLRPARPGEGPGLVWDIGPTQPWALAWAPALPEPFASPPDLLELTRGTLMIALPEPRPEAPSIGPDPAVTAPWPTRAPIPAAPLPGTPPEDLPAALQPWLTLLPPAPPRPPIAAEPLFPAPVLAGGVRLHIVVAGGTEGVFHRPEVTDRAPEGLGWRITGGADAALFLMDPAAGTLGFLTPPDAARPGDADADGVYEVAFEVRDAWGAAAAQRLLVAVTDAVWG